MKPAAAQPSRLRLALGIAALLAGLGGVATAGCTGEIDDAEPEALSSELRPDRQDVLQPLASDVYVLEDGQLVNPTGTTPEDAPLFNAAGTPLDVTWGKFSSARAHSSAFCWHHGNKTKVFLHFQNLIPNGVYSIFYVTFGPDSRNPLCETQERGIPLTRKTWRLCERHPQLPLCRRQGPDASSFVADRHGRAFYMASVDGCLLESTKLDFVLIYHHDGQTYHPLANRGQHVTQGDECRSSYGIDAMRQLVVVQKQPF